MMTDLLKLPGEAECMVRGAGHHPLRSNGISGRLNETNDGEQKHPNLLHHAHHSQSKITPNKHTYIK